MFSLLQTVDELIYQNWTIICIIRTPMSKVKYNLKNIKSESNLLFNSENRQEGNRVMF